jgi:hypothetical protein
MNESQSTLVFDVTPPAAPPAGRRRSVLAERYDLAVAWMSAAVLGSIAISLVPESTGVIRMLLPLVIMCVYVGFALTRVRFSTPKVADSVYFLGFLWTLWALIDVLVGKQGLKAAELYVAFGYALTATAAGMFLRLALLQFFRTIDDQEEEAVDSLDVHVAKLTAELQVCQQAAAALTTSAGDALERWHQEFLARSTKAVDAVTRMSGDFSSAGASLTGALGEIKTSVTATGRNFSTLEKRLGEATIKISERLGAAVEALEKRMLELVTRVEKIEIPPDVLTSELRKVTVATSASLQPLIELAAETLRQLKTSVEEVAAAVKRLPADEELQSAVQGAAGHLRLVSSACSLLADTAAKSDFALSGVTESAGKMATFVVQIEGSLGESMKGVAAELQNVRAAAKTVETALKDVVTFAGHHLR